MNHKFKNYFFFFIAFFVVKGSIAQTPTLEMFAGAGNTTLSGPVTTNQVITFQRNTDNPTANTIGTYTPLVTVTYALSNQQFASVEGVSGTPGVVFGGSASTNGNNGTIVAVPIFNTVGSTGSPDNTHYTTCATCTPGTGMDITTNQTVTLFNIADALITSAGVQNFALNARVQFADLTFTFSRPVSNPILDLTGLGGGSAYSVSGINYTMGYTTDIDMVTPGLTFTALSGSTYLSVSPTSITNTATYFGGNTAGGVTGGVTRYAASGSVLVSGTNINSFTVRIFLKGDGGLVTNASGQVVPATNGNEVRWAYHAGFVPAGGTSQENVTGDRFQIGVSLRSPVTVSGNVFNDVNGGNVNNSSGTTNAVPSGMYANLTDASGRVVATVAVNTNGTYTFPSVFEGTYTVSISQTQGVQGNIAPAVTLPAGWGSTGEFNGAANTGNDGNPNGISASFTVAGSNVGNINFGIQRLPESAVSSQVAGINPGGTSSTTVNPSWFVTSNVGSNPNTQDYDNGTITSIRITAFPANATSITINGTTYTSSTWPVGGVTIPYNAVTGPTQTISVDPVDGGLVNVVIPFVAIDNAGAEDPTPGSVTIRYSGSVDPDLNSGYVNNPITGNMATNNNNFPTGTVFSSTATVPAGVTNPSAAVPTINPDGTYSFTATVPGVYVFDVQVCEPSPSTVCLTNRLTITVADPNMSTNPPVANPDLATTKPNTPVTFNTLGNDQPGANSSPLNPGSVTITTPPANGTVTVDPVTGNTTYTPNPGFVGTDIIRYQVCDNAAPPKCTESYQVVTIAPTGTNNVTSASDDYKITPLNNQVSGNVLTNDVDLEGNTKTVSTPGTFTVPGKGTLVLNLDGTYTFTPVTGFTGPVNFPYTMCDNGTPQACDNATLYIMVTPLGLLPIKLESFTAILRNGVAELNWVVSEEVNVDYYEVEYSKNGIFFETFASKPATGSRTYNQLHSNLQQGVNYYRLKVVDKDGSVNYSPVRIITMGNEKGLVLLYPNPASNQLLLTLGANLQQKTVRMEVFNAAGSLVLNRLVQQASQTEVLDVMQLAPGQYTVRISHQDVLVVRSFVILR